MSYLIRANKLVYWASEVRSWDPAAQAVTVYGLREILFYESVSGAGFLRLALTGPDEDASSWSGLSGGPDQVGCYVETTSIICGVQELTECTGAADKRWWQLITVDAARTVHGA